MATDIILDDQGKERITFAATSLKTTATDFIMDSPVRHQGTPGLRRAMVHDANDGLTLNFNGDYPGGVRVIDAQIRLKIYPQFGASPVLPKRGAVGDLIAIVCISARSLVAQEQATVAGQTKRPKSPVASSLVGMTVEGVAAALSPEGENISLWLCVRGGARRIAYWREIPLGATVKGNA